MLNLYLELYFLFIYFENHNNKLYKNDYRQNII